MPRIFVDGCKTAAIDWFALPGSPFRCVIHVTLNDAGTEDSAISFNSSSTAIYSKHILQADMLHKGICTGFDKQRFAEQSAKLARIAEEFAIERVSIVTFIVTNANPVHGICIVGLCGEFWLHGDGSVELHTFAAEIKSRTSSSSTFHLIGKREQLVGSSNDVRLPLSAIISIYIEDNFLAFSICLDI